MGWPTTTLPLDPPLPLEPPAVPLEDPPMTPDEDVTAWPLLLLLLELPPVPGGEGHPHHNVTAAPSATTRVIPRITASRKVERRYTRSNAK